MVNKKIFYAKIFRLLLNKNMNYWLRIQYSKHYETPLTALRVIECDYESPEYLVNKYKINLLIDSKQKGYRYGFPSCDSVFSNFRGRK